MRSRLLFDIETNGLLKEVTKVHCMAILDTETGEQWSYKGEDIEKGLEELYEADVLIGHNIVAYDLPVLRKLYGWNRRPGCNTLDTLVACRLMRPAVAQEDHKRIDFPPKLVGSHSLRAWGLRLGVPKGDYEGGWDEWSPEMHKYMEQDVRTTFKLLTHLKPWEYPKVPLDLEHRVAEICSLMEIEGWTFDKENATKLYIHLVKRRDELEKELVDLYGQWEEVDRVLVPKRDNKKLGYTAGVPVTKMKTVVFNPGSRQHIERKLKEAGWEPKEFTHSGRAKLDERVLGTIDKPEAKLLVEYLLTQKRLGQIGDGTQGLLRVLGSDGRIHGTINPCGTVTGRAAHHSPNVGQIPANRAKYGKEFRACFTVPAGWKLVGADQQGLELRCFAHYLHQFDKGEYAKVVTEGDVHTHNQTAAGLETRDQAKTFIYAMLYGAGNAKIGDIVGGSSKHGAALRSRFASEVPAYQQLVTRVEAKAREGFITGLDGRKLFIRSEHSALNTLLQNAGAILCKQTLVNFYESMGDLKHGYDGDYVICGWIHDEWQVACREELADLVGSRLVHAAKTAGEPYAFKVPLDASYVIGNNWSETH